MVERWELRSYGDMMRIVLTVEDKGAPIMSP
jgi:hypothetical protein